MSIESRVIQLICDVVGLNKNEVKLDSTVDSIGMDSLDKIECLMAIEEDFDLEILDEAAERLTSVKDVIDYVTYELNQTKK